MPTSPAPTIAARAPRFPHFLLAVLVCALAVVAAYSNSLRGVFVFDDWHTITQNPSIRSLANIPTFFTDASTFSLVPGNVDYRPVLQTSYALNYAMARATTGDGLDPRPWHIVQLLLHFTCALSLFAIGRRLFGSGGLSNLKGLPAPHGDWIALLAAAIFAVHPITSGCANYISSRSTLLVGAFSLPALALYLHVLARAERRILFVPALILLTLALLTKIEAVSLLPVFFAAEFLLAPATASLPLRLRLLRMDPWLRLGPATVVTVMGLIVWKVISPLTGSATRSDPGMTPSIYLFTQFSAWWHYIGQLFAPIDLVFDEQTYPISRSIADPRAAFSLLGWVIVGAVAFLLRRAAPAATFLISCYLLWLLPHSSVVPLSEMVNEHRPYIACAGLFPLFFAALYLLIERIPGVTARRPLLFTAALALAAAIPLVLATRARNAVWRDDVTLWADTAAKTPRSPRARTNYGLALLRHGDYARAEAELRHAADLDPDSVQVLVNLAALLEAHGDLQGAFAAIDHAIRVAPDQPGPLFRRGCFRARHADLPGAITDFAAAADRNPLPIPELAALAECLGRTGRAEEAERVIQEGRSIDAARFEQVRAQVRADLFPAISAPAR